MFDIKSICVTSTVPDRLNSNASIRRFLVEGFVTAFPDALVAGCALEAAPDVIKRTEPQIVVAVGSLAIDSIDLFGLKRAAKAIGCPLALWLHDDPYEYDYSFKAESLADFVFTNEAWCVSHYQLEKVFHLPLAASPKTHYREVQPANERDIDVFFCGVAYPNRIKFFRSEQRYLTSAKVVVRGAGWPEDLSFAKNTRLSPEEVCDYAQRSLMTINMGRSHNIANRRFDLPATTPGPRTFEIAMSGSAQVCIGDSLAITDFLKLGEEVLLAESPIGFHEIVEDGITHPDNLIEIAARAQRRVLANDTYADRARSMIRFITGHE